MKTKTNTPETTPANAGLQTTAAAAPAADTKAAPKQKAPAKAAKKIAKRTKDAPAKATKKSSKKIPKPAPAVVKPQRETRKAMVLGMIARPAGASLDAIMKATGWQRHTVRGFVSICGRDPKIHIESVRNEKGERVYRAL